MDKLERGKQQIALSQRIQHLRPAIRQMIPRYENVEDVQAWLDDNHDALNALNAREIARELGYLQDSE